MRRYLIPLTLLIILNAAAAMAERLTVTAPIANIRSGPGSKYDILWKVEKYYPILVIEKKGEWYHFKDFEDDKGWVYKKLVQKVEAVIT